MDQPQNSEGTAPTPETTPPVVSTTPAQTPVDHTTLMSVLAYLGPLVFIPLLVEKEDSFVRFHVRQGLVLFVIEAALWILGDMMYGLWGLIRILNLVTLVFMVIGIINVVHKKEKELPFIGQFAHYFNKI